MFEQVNKKLKRRISKAVSIVLCAAMLVTGLPAELLGGVANVKAEDVEASKYVGTTGTDTDWSAEKTVEGVKVKTRTTVWDFTAIKSANLTDNSVLKTGQFLSGIKAVYGEKDTFVDSSGKSSEKNTLSFNKAGYFSVLYGGKLAIPLQDETTSVEVTIQNNNDNATRAVIIGNDTTARTIYLKSKNEDKTKDEDACTNKEYTGTFNVATYKSTIDDKAWLLLTVLEEAASTAEVKIEKISITETKPSDDDNDGGNGGGNEGGDGDEGDVSDGDLEGSFDGSDKTWDFTTKETVSIQNKVDEYKGLQIDAKWPEGATQGGKFEFRSQGDVQINKGTTIGIPVNGDCKITVVAYGTDNTYANYTLDGKTPTSDTNIFSYDYVGPKKYVELVTTDTTYLYSISTENVKIDVPPVDPDAGQKKDVAVTLTGNTLLADGDKVVLLNTADASDEVEIDNNTAKLTVGKSYIALVKGSDGKEKATLTARINGSRSFAVTSQTTSITVAVTQPEKDENGDLEATRTIEYDFSSNASKAKPEENGIVAGTNTVTSGILYKKYVDSGVTFDSDTLRFRLNNILWIPIQDDTTKVTYTQTCSANQSNRPVYIGKDGANSKYSVEMTSEASSVTISDITDLVETHNGQKYLPIQSGGDVKIKLITLAEYNPVNTVVVSGTIADAAGKNITSIKFKNLTNAQAPIVSADVDAAGKYTVELRRVDGNTRYVASISAPKHKLNGEDGANQLTLSGNGATATKDFTVVDKAVATVSGTVSGAETIGNKELGVTLIPDDAAADPVPLTLTKDGNTYTFTDVTLEQGASYSVELTNADDYEVTGKFTIAKAETDELKIEAKEKTKQKVSGKFVTSDGRNANVTKITFTNMDTPEYKYTFEVSGDGYDVDLRAAEYETSAEAADGYDVFDHVSVKTEAVENDVYLQGPVDTSEVRYKETITVGEGAGKDFEKIADAIAYITRMNRTDDQRVTIVLDNDATYREQLIIDTPNITIKGNGSTITWYYGVGFSYYSAAEKTWQGKKQYFYDEAHAVDKYYKNTIAQNPGHWGATVNLYQNAKGFAAENLTFENSLNYYVTEEELKDGASTNSSAGVTARADGIDVFAKAAKERGCVLYIEKADDTTYKECKFFSEQDTIYTGDADESSYFVNCEIEGNTDYICGDGNAVFDTCKLRMYCNTPDPTKPDETHTESSFIAANKDVAGKAGVNHGYLFSNCTIVRANHEGTMPTRNNYLDRAWAAGRAYFMNTVVETADMICTAAYADMNAKVANAYYYEYNTHTSDGTNVIPDYEVYELDKDGNKKVITPGRVKSKGGTMTEAESKFVIMSEFFDGWKPLYYEGKMEVGNLPVTLTVPEAGEAVENTVTCTKSGIASVSNITWYEGNATTGYTGGTFKENTTYRAVFTATIADGFTFTDVVKALIAGAADAEVVVSVSQDKKTATITATFNLGETKPPTTRFDLPITLDGLKEGKKYEGGFSVLEDFYPYGSTTGEIKGPKTVAGVDYDIWLQGTTNPKPNHGKIPTAGAALKLEALADGEVTIIGKTTKQVSFVDATEGGDGVPILNDQNWEDKEYKFEVKKGHTYYFYADGGSKIELCAAFVVYDGEVKDDGSTVPGTNDGGDKPGTNAHVQ